MAYKKKTAETKTTSATVSEKQEVSTPASSDINKSFVVKSKDKIPMDALVTVRNLTGGKLVYVSKHLQGYTVEWEKFGDEVPMEMSELYYMKNTDSKFFKENWIEVDINVLRDLHMEQYYKETISIDEILNMFDLEPSSLIEKVKKQSRDVKNAIGLKAIEMIDAGQLTDINVISALEEAINCELYKR